MRPGVLLAVTVSLVTLASGCSGDAGPGDARPPASESPTSSPSTPSEPPESPSEDGTGALPGTGTTIGVAPGGAPGRCLPPTAENLARAEVAVDATVTARDEAEVVLTPTRWYAGDPTATLTVRAIPDVLSDLLRSVDLREGERYLVAAGTEGTVMICGFSGPWSPRRERLYERAFPS